MAVGTLAGHREEQGAGRDGTGVIREIAHLDRRAPQHLHRLER